MVEMTFDQVLNAAQQLSREEQEQLIRQLEGETKQPTLYGKFACTGSSELDGDDVESYLRQLNSSWDELDLE